MANANTQTQNNLAGQASVSLYDAFGVESPNSDTRKVILNRIVPVGTCREIEPDPGYVFEHEPVKRALANIARKQPVWCWGPSGCGKTEFFRQIAARLQRPFRIISCGEEMSLRELLGTFELAPPPAGQEDQDSPEEGGMKSLVRAVRDLARRGLGMQTRFRYGQLVRAIRTPGAIVVLDEFNMAPPGVAAQFNRLLEAGELFIPETGERVKVADHVVFVVTANTAGGMDETGLYAGSQVQNGATRARFVGMRMDYPSESTEVEIIRRAYPDLDGKVAMASNSKTASEVMVEVARAVRVLVEEGAVSLPFTIRQLKNWAHSTLMYQDMNLAFRDAYLDLLPPDEATPVEEVFQKNLGVNP